MKTKPKFSKEQVRRFLIDRHILRYLPHQKAREIGMEQIRPLECIQIDPLRIVERNHHLVLHNRFDNFRPDMLEDMAYKRRELIEMFFNALCFVPVEEYHYHRMRQKLMGEEFGIRLRKFDKEIRIVKKAIRTGGAMQAADFKTSEKTSWGFGFELKRTTAALEYLWYGGELMTERRENNKRFYNFPEKVLPPQADRRLPTLKRYQEFMLAKYFRCCYLGDLRHPRFGGMYIKGLEKKRITEPLIKRGELIALDIEDVKYRYLITRNDLELLKASDDIQPDSRVRFMAPLDNMLFNREIISEIFDFNFRWEVYTTPKKRKYGYYTMPILHGLDFIGRIDPKSDRKTNTLVFNHIQLEDHIKITGKLLNEIVQAAKRMAAFAEMKDIMIAKTTPSKIKAELDKLL